MFVGGGKHSAYLLHDIGSLLQVSSVFTESHIEVAMYQPERFYSKRLAGFTSWAQKLNLLANLRPQRREIPQLSLKRKRKQGKLKINSYVGFLNSDAVTAPSVMKL